MSCHSYCQPMNKLTNITHSTWLPFLFDRPCTKYCNLNDCSFYGQTGILNLESSLYGILLAGTDTVSAFLEWFIMYMTAFPEVQEKCNREVEAVIGNRTATLEDRTRTHYLEATLQEISRHCPHLALTVQHYLTADTTVGGYALPKGTQVACSSSTKWSMWF